MRKTSGDHPVELVLPRRWSAAVRGTRPPTASASPPHRAPSTTALPRRFSGPLPRLRGSHTGEAQRVRTRRRSSGSRTVRPVRSRWASSGRATRRVVPSASRAALVVNGCGRPASSSTARSSAPGSSTSRRAIRSTWPARASDRHRRRVEPELPEPAGVGGGERGCRPGRRASASSARASPAAARRRRAAPARPRPAAAAPPGRRRARGRGGPSACAAAVSVRPGSGASTRLRDHGGQLSPQLGGPAGRDDPVGHDHRPLRERAVAGAQPVHPGASYDAAAASLVGERPVGVRERARPGRAAPRRRSDGGAGPAPRRPRSPVAGSRSTARSPTRSGSGCSSRSRARSRRSGRACTATAVAPTWSSGPLGQPACRRRAVRRPRRPRRTRPGVDQGRAAGRGARAARPRGRAPPGRRR